MHFHFWGCNLHPTASQSPLPTPVPAGQASSSHPPLPAKQHQFTARGGSKAARTEEIFSWPWCPYPPLPLLWCCPEPPLLGSAPTSTAPQALFLGQAQAPLPVWDAEQWWARESAPAQSTPNHNSKCIFQFHSRIYRPLHRDRFFFQKYYKKTLQMIVI